MASRLDSRIKRLEALRDGKSPLDELTTSQMRALLAYLSDGVEDEAAMASIQPGTRERLVAWCEARSES